MGRDLVEDFDRAVLGFLQEEPGYLLTGVGLGNAHLYANEYLPTFAIPYAADTAFVAKSGYLRLISEVGLVGLALFLLWVGSQMRILSRAGKNLPPGLPRHFL